MKHIIFEDLQQEIMIECSTEYSNDFMEILNHTIWGTEGTLYTMHDLEKECQTFKEPYYVVFKEKSWPVAVCLYNQKPIKVNGMVHDCFYLCLLAVKPQASGKGYGTLLVTKSADYFLTMPGHQGIVYAYVEAENEKSLRVFEKSNFKFLDSFSTPVFSRINPRWNPMLLLWSRRKVNLCLIH